MKRLLGMGNALVDALLRLENDDLLARLGLAKGAMQLIDTTRFHEIRLRLEGLHMARATGGSAVYSARAMEHLKKLGTVVYLELGPEEVERRIPSLAKRGVVMRGNVKDVKGLHEERKPLYEKYADITVSCDGKNIDETVEAIASAAGFEL